MKSRSEPARSRNIGEDLDRDGYAAAYLVPKNFPAFDLTEHATKARANRNRVTLWAIIGIAALALIITVVVWFAIHELLKPNHNVGPGKVAALPRPLTRSTAASAATLAAFYLP